MNTPKHNIGPMTPQALYDLLDKSGVDFEVIEIFEGVRLLRVIVEESDEVDT